MHALFFTFLVLGITEAPINIAKAEDIKTDTQTVITAPYLNVFGDVQSYPEKVSLTQDPLSLDLNASLQKLPGAIVTQFSGPGSQSAIIAPIATGSGGTLVTLDDIPVINPFGRATDLTYFPSSFFKQVDWFSPFYPWSEGRTAPGGRLNLITKTPLKKDQTEIVGNALYGTANTQQLSAAVMRETSHNSWLLGLTGFKTDGNFNYVDPRDSSQQTRSNNDNKYMALLLKNTQHFSDKTVFDFSGLTQVGHRTDPGSLTTPTAAIGHDVFFGQGALKLTTSDLWFENSKQSWNLSHSVDRSYYTNLTSYTFGAGPPTTTVGGAGGENAQGDFFSWQIAGTEKRRSLFFQTDALYEKVDAYYPVYADRQVFGATLAYDAFKLTETDFVIPRARYEQISTFQGQPDGSLSYIHEFASGHEAFMSVSLLHKIPSMIALNGYLEGGIPVTGLPTLPVERLEVYSMGYNLVEKHHGLWLNTWYSHHRNMALRSSSSQGLGLFTQVSDAQTYGVSAQFTCQFLEKWGTLLSGSLERTRNNDLGTELTFKPHYVLSATLTYEILKQTNLAIEDVYEGTRYFSASNVSRFPNGSTEPMNWTNLKISSEIGPGSLYIKATNIFDAAGFDNPGYPYPGRSYWLGYSYNGTL